MANRRASSRRNIAVTIVEKNAVKSIGRLRGLIAVSAILLLFVILAFGSVTQKSPTIDEHIHLLGGYSYLKWSDFRVNPEHPPLAKIWAAFPLLWLNVNVPESGSAAASYNYQGEPPDRFYGLAREMFFVRNDASTLFFYAKLQMVFLGLLLGWYIYLWSREIFGFGAGLVSLAGYSLDPNFLAHSAIVHTDVPFAAVFFIGTYYYWRCLQKWTWFNLVPSAICFGLAVTTKYSYIWLFMAWVALGLVKIVAAEPIVNNMGTPHVMALRREKAWIVTATLLSSAIVAYAMLWAVYGFRYYAAIENSPTWGIATMPSQTDRFVGFLEMIAGYHLMPEAWIYGHYYVMKELTRNMYFLGAVSSQGFWLYFPIAFLVKTPVPTILLGFAAVWLCSRQTVVRARVLTILIPAAIYFCAIVVFRLNIGIRHLLPVYPFLFVLIGGAVDQLWREGSRLKRSGLVLLGLWSIWSALSSYPHFLSYFNELAGGPKSGHKWLLDSNLDWGQDLKGLKGWMDRNAVKKIQLVYFGTATPEYYGIDDFYSKENLAAWASSPGGEVDLPQYLAVSANFLYGGELYLPRELAERLGRYSRREPDASIGYSLLVFKLDLSDARVYQDAAAIATEGGTVKLPTALLSKALRLDPADAEAYFQLGGLMVRQGNLDTAIENYRAAIKLRPDFTAAYHNLGRVLAAQGRIDEAVKNYYQALRISPEFAEAHRSLGQALARLGKTDEAAVHYQEALRILKRTGRTTDQRYRPNS